jgi:hypothetical protein
MRERGPVKTWTQETMAAALRAVLQNNLSLSRSARMFEIPYPTFVLYANKLHNLLGPSAGGGNPTLLSYPLSVFSPDLENRIGQRFVGVKAINC